jgi:hypothetical protein
MENPVVNNDSFFDHVKQVFIAGIIISIVKNIFKAK